MQTTPIVSQLKATFKISHPFHPLYGKVFTLISYRNSWRTAYIEYLGDDNLIATVPIEWTDVHGIDPFVEQSQGRAYYRVEDLLKLSDLLTDIN